jgi:acetyltransferase-like isoleucine patch superfamily enzyme
MSGDLRAVARSAVRVASAQWFLRSADVERTVRLHGRPVIRNRGTIVISDRVRLVSNVAALELETGPEGAIEIGAGSFLNFGTLVRAFHAVRIGADCQFGTYCLLADNLLNRFEPERRNELPPSEPITIGDNVWLASRVVIMPGVTIGSGSVVGAGSVVVGDIAPRTLVAGVPAKVIREL